TAWLADDRRCVGRIALVACDLGSNWREGRRCASDQGHSTGGFLGRFGDGDHGRNREIGWNRGLTRISEVKLAFDLNQTLASRRDHLRQLCLCRTSTRVPGLASTTVTLAPSCLDKASMIPVPRPGFSRFSPTGIPAPLSDTDSSQASPSATNETVILPPTLWSGKACLMALITSSVTIRPMLTDTSEFVAVSSTLVSRISRRGSSIMEAEMLRHRSAKDVRKSTDSSCVTASCF